MNILLSMITRNRKAVWGMILGIALPTIGYLVVTTGADDYIREGLAAYCSLPQEKRLEYREAVAKRLGEDRVEIHCANDQATVTVTRQLDTP